MNSDLEKMAKLLFVGWYTCSKIDSMVDYDQMWESAKDTSEGERWFALAKIVIEAVTP